MTESAHPGGSAGRCMACPRLPDDQLHVWQVDLDDPHAQADDCIEVLDGAERARAERFAFAPLRRRYLAAHAALRGILGHVLRRPPEQLRLGADANGKPRLTQTPPPLRFNLSHSGGTALVAVSWHREVGVDVERWAGPPNLLPMVERHFSATEREAFWSLAASERTRGFYRWWTLKEACLKAVGLGLRHPLAAFSVEFRPQHQPRLIEAPAALGSLQLWPLALAEPGWSAALAWAVPGAPLVPVLRRWSWHGWRI